MAILLHYYKQMLDGLSFKSAPYAGNPIAVLATNMGTTIPMDDGEGVLLEYPEALVRWELRARPTAGWNADSPFGVQIQLLTGFGIIAVTLSAVLSLAIHSKGNTVLASVVGALQKGCTIG